MALTQKERSAIFYKKRKDNGLCPRCGKQLDREGHYCSECNAKHNKYVKETRAFLRKQGMCPVCGKEKLFGDEKQCISCRQKAYERRKPLTDEQKEQYSNRFKKQQKTLYTERAEKGICTRCGKRKASAGKKKATVSYKKVSGISGYQVKAGTNRAVTKGTKTNNTTKTKYTMNSLKSKKRYYMFCKRKKS